MAVNLKGRSFLTLADFTPEELRYLLDLGHDLKAKRRAGVCAPTMQGKHIVLLFEKTSTRTRCSFEVAATQEGAHVTYLDAGSSQMGKKESLEDSAKVLGRFFDGIEYRGYEQSVVEDLAKWSGVPVWNGLTDADHPTQILADLMTIEEHCKKPLNKIKVVFPGDVRNNMCYAWMMGAAKLGMHFVAMGPEELAKQMDQEVVQSTFAEARKNGGLIEITDHAEDLKGADVIYGDVWASMGEEAQIPELSTLFLVAGIVVGLMDRLSEVELAETFVSGCTDLLGVAFIIGISRGITVLMNDGHITDTILHWGETALSGLGSTSFVLLVFLIYLPLSVLIPSSSGLATLSVPVVAPLGQFAGVGGDVVVTAFQSACGLVNLVTPTAAVVMGALALGRIPYEKWLKFVWKLILLFLLLTGLLLVLAAALS